MLELSDDDVDLSSLEESFMKLSLVKPKCFLLLMRRMRSNLRWFWRGPTHVAHHCFQDPSLFILWKGARSCCWTIKDLLHDGEMNEGVCRSLWLAPDVYVCRVRNDSWPLANSDHFPKMANQNFSMVYSLCTHGQSNSWRIGEMADYL